MRALGVRIEQPHPTEVRIHGVGLRGLKAAPHALDMGNAGTAIRLFTGLLAAQAFSSRLIGDESLMKRPMERVAKPLREMGAEVRTHDGKPPIDIEGGRRLHGIDYRMPVASAQVKSAILLAGLYAEGPTTVTAPAVCRDHSERMLLSCGVRLESEGLSTTIYPPERLTAAISRCPGTFPPPHFSSWRAFWAAPGTACCCAMWDLIRLAPVCSISCAAWAENRNPECPQLAAPNRWPICGCGPRRLRVSRCPPRSCLSPSTNFRCCSSPPPAPRGRLVITGAEELRVKESDRIAAMSAGFKTLGVEHRVTPDGMRIEGRADGPAFGGGEVEACGDHRIAMAFSIASLRAAKPIWDPRRGERGDLFPGFVGLARSAVSIWRIGESLPG